MNVYVAHGCKMCIRQITWLAIMVSTAINSRQFEEPWSLAWVLLDSFFINRPKGFPIKDPYIVLGSWRDYKHTKPGMLSWTERLHSHIGTETRPWLWIRGSSEESWAMGQRLTQLCQQDDWRLAVVKSFFWTNHDDSINIGPANTRASRRGNTRGTSVILHDWAYRVCRR